MRPIGPASPMRGLAAAADLLGRRQVAEVGTMAFARVHHRQPFARHAASSFRFGSIIRRSCDTSLPSISPKPPGSRKSRCMSMISSAQVAGENSNGYGSASTVNDMCLVMRIALMNARRVGHRAEDAALHGDHLERGQMVPVVGRAGAVREQQTFVAAIVGVAHGRVDADVGRDAGERDVLDALAMEQQVQIGGVERTLPRLVDDRFARRAARAPE